jgi:uncharacterized protein YjiS (DUF1127 family)
MTTDIITARPSASGICLDALVDFLKSPLRAWARWREHQHAAADLAAMSAGELKDLGLERDSHLVTVARGRAHFDGIYPV